MLYLAVMKLPWLKTSLLINCLLIIYSSSAQNHTISGNITDYNSGEYLIGANVYSTNNSTSTSDVYGFYSITLTEGVHYLEFSYVGYQPVSKQINLTEDVRLDLELKSLLLLQEATIDAEKNKNTQSGEMGTISLELEKIKTLPAFLGEVDILKIIQFLPGVQANGEGNSGFYVRGGSADQNLILLDNATVYNASHLLGFFSVVGNTLAFRGVAWHTLRPPRRALGVWSLLGIPRTFGVRWANR